jgi:hypothetical protein
VSEDTEDARERKFDSWRIVAGEQSSIRLHLVSIQPQYMGKLESKWSLFSKICSGLTICCTP